jgi:hypothetical protein
MFVLEILFFLLFLIIFILSYFIIFSDIKLEYLNKNTNF